MTAALRFKSILIPLLVVFLSSVILLTVMDRLTRDHIANNARLMELRVINPVMPLVHDNELYDDYLDLTDTGDPAMDNVTVFRARNNGKPAGAVFMPVTATGYSGKIQLIIGIDYDGSLVGVRVLTHRETPGLGDRIDHTQSDWIKLFTGRSLADPMVTEWTVQADGGKFDQLSGATITSRGVVNAVRRTLEFYQANRDRLYSKTGNIP